ncbi:MAG TPA: hypothetical protein VK786_04510 [bacterium]|jgi:hypothetical protein|nr:hypothetical protein [bacterium]
MCPLSCFFAAAAVALAVIWPLAFFGYRYYASLVAAEMKKHEEQAAGH